MKIAGFATNSSELDRFSSIHSLNNNTSSSPRKRNFVEAFNQNYRYPKQPNNTTTTFKTRYNISPSIKKKLQSNQQQKQYISNFNNNRHISSSNSPTIENTSVKNNPLLNDNSIISVNGRTIKHETSMIFKKSNFSKTDNNNNKEDSSSSSLSGLKSIADSIFSYVTVAGGAALSFLTKATALPTDSQHDDDDDNSLSRPLKRKKVSNDSNQPDFQQGDSQEPIIPGQFPGMTRKTSIQDLQQNQSTENNDEENLSASLQSPSSTNKHHTTSAKKTPFKDPESKAVNSVNYNNSKQQSFLFGSPSSSSSSNTPTRNRQFSFEPRNSHGNQSALISPLRHGPSIPIGSPFFSFSNRLQKNNSTKHSDSLIFSSSPIINLNSIQKRQFPSQVGGGNIFSKNPMIPLDNNNNNNTYRSSPHNNNYSSPSSSTLLFNPSHSSSPSTFTKSPLLSRVFSSTPRSRHISPSRAQYDLFVPKPKIPLFQPQLPPSHSVAADLYQQLLERRERELQEIEELKKQEEQLRAISADKVLPLNDDQLDEVEEVWNMRNFNQEIVMAFRVPIYVRDLRTLRHGSWLNDSVIDFYLSMITARSQQQQQQQQQSSTLPKVFSFTTHFYSTLQNSGYQGVRKWAKRKQINVTQTDYIFVPINRNNSHWCLAVINNKAQSFEFYDSMNGSGHQALAHLKEYMKLEAKNVDPGFDVSIYDGYKMYGNSVKCPQQQNAYDCGVFVCKFVEVLSREGSLDSFSQKHMPYIRERMVYEIIHTRLLS